MSRRSAHRLGGKLSTRHAAKGNIPIDGADWFAAPETCSSWVRDSLWVQLATPPAVQFTAEPCGNFVTAEEQGDAA